MGMPSNRRLLLLALFATSVAAHGLARAPRAAGQSQFAAPPEAEAAPGQPADVAEIPDNDGTTSSAPTPGEPAASLTSCGRLVANPRVSCYTEYRCNSCHRSARPRGGDRPSYRYSAFSIRNDTQTTLRYQVRTGERGAWVTCSVAPGKRSSHYVKYERPNQNASPRAYIRFDDKQGPARDVFQSVLAPLATPYPTLGNEYHFRLHAGSFRLQLHDRSRDR